MGVKGFNSWFAKTYPYAYVQVKRRYDHLYIDMASILHEVTRKGEARRLAGCSHGCIHDNWHFINCVHAYSSHNKTNKV